MNKYFLLALIHFSFPLEASAASILDKYFDSLPIYNAQYNVDLNYDFKRGKFSWHNSSEPAARLLKLELPTTPTKNEFSNSLINQPTELFKVLFSLPKTNGLTPISESLISFDDPLSVIISHLNESIKSTQKTNQPIPASQPASFWIVVAGLLGFFALLSKKFRKEKLLPELTNLATTNTAINHPKNQQEKPTYLAKFTNLKHFYIPPKHSKTVT